MALPPRLERPDLTDAQAYAAVQGAWQLVVWTTFHADGSSSHTIGADAMGQIMYSADGHMSCHLMPGNRPLTGKPSVYALSDAELGRAMQGYSGYSGPYTIDARAGVITHHVTGAWFPDWIGTTQPRRYAFSGDRLFLEAEIGGDLVRIEWRKVVTAEALRLGGSGE